MFIFGNEEKLVQIYGLAGHWRRKLVSACPPSHALPFSELSVCSQRSFPNSYQTILIPYNFSVLETSGSWTSFI
ncbi:hypothetical protein K1719_035041 [Acacia pycnantha]|nr:hypothetical protein K1719_035041 [Acacia pycnantha]